MIHCPAFGDDALLNLFRGRFEEEAGNAYAEFLSLVDAAALPFDLVTQIRTLEYPPTLGFEEGLPTSCYYFVPGSGWGTEKPAPAAPLDNSFVYSSDGMQLNLGCPLRLFVALRRLETLQDKGDLPARLSMAHTHLAAVEELIWADIWRPDYALSRPHAPEGTFDWKVYSEKVAVNLECKFRPSDWARLVDGEDCEPITLLKKPAKQLSGQTTGVLNAVAFTGYGPVTESFLGRIEEELEQFPHIHAILYATLPGDFSVHSLDEKVCEAICAAIEPRRADYFQLHYHVIHRLADTRARKIARLSRERKAQHRLFSQKPTALKTRRVIHGTGGNPAPYRLDIVGRNSDTGEPHFEIVPSHIIETQK